MKYFMDLEFIEHATGIELLSIGIVAEDGRTFYAENTAVDKRLANDWVKENVISKLNAFELYENESKSSFMNFTSTGIEVKGDYDYIKQYLLYYLSHDTREPVVKNILSPPTFYAYYADYDWVVFCKIFGRMIDLPKHFPMYCRDLKQTLDEKVDLLDWYYNQHCAWSDKDLTLTLDWITTRRAFTKDRPGEFDEKLAMVKKLEDYPKQENEHNALADALFNKKLYYFLQNL